MAEPRKNHLSIDGGQVKEDDHVATYKAIPESDTEFRSSKNNLSKSKEKLSNDGAEEKLLPKAEEAKIVTRVDMADAKYVVEDHRNGDAKIELDANKRQFSGLTKEELLKYADDPFWVNLRWAMFVLFWALWLCMLAGAITIIVKAPKCAPPTPKTWFEKGPLVDMGELDYAAVEAELPSLTRSSVQGVFVDVPTYDQRPEVIDTFKAFAKKLKDVGVKVIVDLIPNYVSIDHEWFKKSEARDPPYTDYFVWKSPKYDDGKEIPPNNWPSVHNTSAWNYSEPRKEYYLHQYAAEQPDLNFTNPDVVQLFLSELRRWMQAGAAGVRLNKARRILVNASFEDAVPASGRGSVAGAVHTDYQFWQHKDLSDSLQLDSLFATFAKTVDEASEAPNTGESVFTLKETGERIELFLLTRNVTSLRPLPAAPVTVTHDVTSLANAINLRLGNWSSLQLVASGEMDKELVPLQVLLPAALVVTPEQLRQSNETTKTEELSHVISLRNDASVQHGHYVVSPVPHANDTEPTLLACARWKVGHTGFVAVLNPSGAERRANLSALWVVPAPPAQLAVYHVSQAVRDYTNYTSNHQLYADDVLVPPNSTVVLSYVPNVKK